MQFNNFAIINKNKITIGVIIGILVLLNVFLGFEYFQQYRENQTLQAEVKSQENSKRVADFLDLFVQKVLKTDKEVSFDDRLQLENAIRNINDPELLAKWENFTSGTNEIQIQQSVKELLESLAQKIVS